MNYTHHELERISYITGTGQAPLYAELDTAELREESIDSALTYIQEAKGSFLNEDFLQGAINELLVMSQSRVTKADVVAFMVNLNDLQDQIAQSSEYGLEQLAKAETELGG